MPERTFIILGLQLKGPAGPGMGPLPPGSHIPEGLASLLPSGHRALGPWFTFWNF